MTSDEKYFQFGISASACFFQATCLAKSNLHGNWLKVKIHFISKKMTSEIQGTSAWREEHSKALKVTELKQTDLGRATSLILGTVNAGK